MGDIPEWPHFFKTNLRVLNRDGDIGIVSYWTHVNQVNVEKFNGRVAVVGPLYTREGLKYLKRNCLLNPGITTLIVYGNDRNHVESHLKKKLQTGKNPFYQYFKDHTLFVDPETIDPTTIRIRQPWCAPTFQPLKDLVVCNNFPKIQSEQTGFIVRSNSIADAWRKVMTRIEKYGSIKNSMDQQYLELNDVISVFNEVIDNDISCAPEYETLEEYLPIMLTDKIPNGVAYTYGSRIMRTYDSAIRKLKTDIHSRQVVLPVYDIADDTCPTPPCLTQIIMDYNFGHLNMTIFFRSHDCCRAYCLNLYALNELHKRFCKDLDLEKGSLTLHAVSAHIYLRDMEIVRANTSHSTECCVDQIYFIVQTNKNKIHLSMYEQATNKMVWEGDFGTAHEACDYTLPYLRNPSHAMYLGRELQKAEDCIKSGKEYVQDS